MQEERHEKIYFPTGMQSVVGGTEADNFDIPMLVRIRGYQPTANVGNPINSSEASNPVYEIYLPVPVALSNAYNIEFDTLGVGGFGQIIQGLIGAVSEVADGNFSGGFEALGDGFLSGGARLLDEMGALNLVKRKYGFSFNKFNEMSISKPSNRTFSLNFDFAPASKGEANTVDRIIKLLKLGMHPTSESLGGGSGTSITSGGGANGAPNSTFNPIFRNPLKYIIDFVHRGKKDKEFTRLYKTAPSFITSMNVNYHRAGAPSYLPDGEPTMSSIDLSFTEIFPLTRSALEEIEYGANLSEGNRQGIGTIAPTEPLTLEGLEDIGLGE